LPWPQLGTEIVIRVHEAPGQHDPVLFQRYDHGVFDFQPRGAGIIDYPPGIGLACQRQVHLELDYSM
jgi:hypothetical protein